MSDRTKERHYITDSDTRAFHDAVTRADVCLLVKDTLRHMEVVQVLCSNTDSNWAASIELEEAGNSPRTGTRGGVFIEKTWKQSKDITSVIRA